MSTVLGLGPLHMLQVLLRAQFTFPHEGHVQSTEGSGIAPFFNPMSFSWALLLVYVESYGAGASPMLGVEWFSWLIASWKRASPCVDEGVSVESDCHTPIGGQLLVCYTSVTLSAVSSNDVLISFFDVMCRVLHTGTGTTIYST